MTAKPRRDPELQKIDDLEKLIAEGHPRVIAASGASEAEIERARLAAGQLAATIGERLRQEYRARQSR